MKSRHPLAGQPAPPDQWIDVARLEQAYAANFPDVRNPQQRVLFGTSGHRGSPFDGSFTEAHIVAITQAICDFRRTKGISGPLFMGKDTHAASQAAERTALEVLAANDVQTLLQTGDGFTPTPAISYAILTYNRGRQEGWADGIVITPSHNPPQDGGFKYNPPYGGPADSEVTTWIEQRANELLGANNRGVRRTPYDQARRADTTHPHDFVTPYVNDLATIVDLECVRAAGLRIGVDPLGGAALPYWEPIRERYRLNLTVVNPRVDPTFGFMTLDHDGQIRMDCSSPDAMAGLVRLREQFDIAFGNDPDSDRHGIVTPSAGLLNPNHYLAVAIRYLICQRHGWKPAAVVGKTIVSSSVIDRIVKQLARQLWEVPVGFKWFAPRLFDGSCCFGGEESAGASFVRMNSDVWSTDKDGLILGLLAAEITARTGKDPGQHYHQITEQLGATWYDRVDAPATPAQKAAFRNLTPEAVTATNLAGAPIQAKLTRAPGNQAGIGGLKVITDQGWFAARPSGTEDIYKLYAESFQNEAHLRALQAEAVEIVGRALGN